MIGKIIGALVGGKLAENTKGIGGTTGALLGAAAPVVIKRLSIPAMIVLGAGGYFAKKQFDKKDGSGSQSSNGGAKKSSSKSTGTKSTGAKSKKTMPEPAQKTAPVATPPQPATA